MKRQTTITLAGMAIAGLLAQPQAWAENVITIKLGHVLPDTHSWQIAAAGFAADVESETEGRVVVELYPFGQLGNEKELIEGLQLGTLQAGVIGSGSFQAIEPSFGIIELPYTWPSREAAFAALDGDLGTYLADRLNDKGIVVLGWWENGYRHITTNGRMIEVPSDLRALRIRVTPDKVRLDTFRALGAEPSPLAFNELYAALQQGVFDAQENPLSVIYASSLFEVQDHLSLSAHNWSGAVLAMARPTWEGISPADQADILASGRHWGDLQRAMVAEADSALVAQLQAKGMTVTTVDEEAFKAAVAPLLQSLEGQFGPELMDLLHRYSAAAP